MKKVAVVSIVLALFCIGSAATSNAAIINWSGTAGYSSLANTHAIFDPNGAGTTITGTIDLSGVAIGEVVMFGLIDKTLQDSAGYTWQSGAYAYFYKAGTQLKIGPSDGNLNGAIISGTAGTAKAVPYQDVVPFTLHVHAGAISLESPLLATPLNWTYGSIKTLNNAYGYAWNEFADGAYLGGSPWLYLGGTVEWDLTAAEGTPVPDLASTLLLFGTALTGIAAVRRRWRG